MKRMIVALLVAASVSLSAAGPARADAQLCNIKAVHHTAQHIMKANNPRRISRLTARYVRLSSRCFVVFRHA